MEIFNKLKQCFSKKKKDNRTPEQIFKEDISVFREADSHNLILYNKKSGNKVRLLCFSQEQIAKLQGAADENK